MTKKAKEEIDLGIGGKPLEPADEAPVIKVRALQPVADEAMTLVIDGADNAQMAACLSEFGILGMTADELFQSGIDELNRSVLHSCRAGVAFWAAQEELKKSMSAVADMEELDNVRRGANMNFEEWIAQSGLARQRVYEAIKLARFFSRLSQAQRGQLLKLGKKPALLLAGLPQEVFDRGAENDQDILDEAETMTYGQLREHLRSAEQRGKRLESEIEHRDAVIAKMKQRNPVYQFSPQTHFVREECLVHQAECELALNSLLAMFEETANEDTSTPEWRMRLEQIWVTAHVVTARAMDALNKIKDYAPVSDLPESVLADHRLTDAEASDWLLEYQLLERKHFAAKAEREKKRQDNQPKGPGRPKKEG
jgi:hypothetical protein